MNNAFMNPHFKKNPETHKRNVLFGTGLVLIAAFLLIILLFFAFSMFSTSLMGKCVAVVDIDVPLSVEGVPSTLFSSGVLGSEELANTIDGINARDDVGAVVFVFNSPGGSVVATREVYQSMEELEKPKVAYFREVAASGAYYIASGTDYIISDPDALTGSIGVIATFTEMSGLFEKIGVNVTSITSGEHKDIGSPYRVMSDDERQILQTVVDEVFSEFKSVVIENRKGALDLAKFEEVADGRILTGRQAVVVGLVDQVGTKKDAIIKAAQLSGMEAESIDDVRVCPISTSGEEGGLFSAEAFFEFLKLKSGLPELSYK